MTFKIICKNLESSHTVFCDAMFSYVLEAPSPSSGYMNTSGRETNGSSLVSFSTLRMEAECLPEICADLNQTT
jgi:hypothetical protein